MVIVDIVTDAGGPTTAPSKSDESANIASKSSNTAASQRKGNQSTGKRKAPSRTNPRHYSNSDTSVPEAVSTPVTLYEPPGKWRRPTVSKGNPKQCIVYE